MGCPDIIEQKCMIDPDSIFRNTLTTFEKTVLTITNRNPPPHSNLPPHLILSPVFPLQVDLRDGVVLCELMNGLLAQDQAAEAANGSNGGGSEGSGGGEAAARQKACTVATVHQTSLPFRQVKDIPPTNSPPYVFWFACSPTQLLHAAEHLLLPKTCAQKSVRGKKHVDTLMAFPPGS